MSDFGLYILVLLFCGVILDGALWNNLLGLFLPFPSKFEIDLVQLNLLSNKIACWLLCFYFVWTYHLILQIMCYYQFLLVKKVAYVQMFLHVMQSGIKYSCSFIYNAPTSASTADAITTWIIFAMIAIGQEIICLLFTLFPRYL